MHAGPSDPNNVNSDGDGSPTRTTLLLPIPVPSRVPPDNLIGRNGAGPVRARSIAGTVGSSRRSGEVLSIGGERSVAWVVQRERPEPGVTPSRKCRTSVRKPARLSQGIMWPAPGTLAIRACGLVDVIAESMSAGTTGLSSP